MNLKKCNYAIMIQHWHVRTFILSFCRIIANFISSLYKAYVELYFTYLEINPLVITGGKIYMLDLAAKLDATADFICRSKWGDVEYPPPFGRDAYPEEAYIADLDAKSGASLKVGEIIGQNRLLIKHE